MHKLIAIIALLCATYGTISAQTEGTESFFGEPVFRRLTEKAATDDSDGVQGTNTSGAVMTQSEKGFFDADDNPAYARLKIYIDNMPRNELKGITEGEYKTKKGKSATHLRLDLKSPDSGEQPYLIAYVPANAEKDRNGNEQSPLEYDYIDLKTRYGKARISEPAFFVLNIYEARFEINRPVDYTVQSLPIGAKIWLDDVPLDSVTNYTIPAVSMGRHKLTLRHSNNDTEAFDGYVDVSEIDHRKFIDLRKKRDITFEADNKNATIQATNIANQETYSGKGTLELHDVRMGSTYEVTTSLGGQKLSTHEYSIKSETPERIQVSTKKTKRINFLAFQNNKLVNAEVRLNNENIGKTMNGDTRLWKDLEYGKYEVTMSAGGYDKKETLIVDDKTGSSFSLTINPVHSVRARWNPFDVDYNARKWNVTAGYCNRIYVNKRRPAKGYIGSTVTTKHDNWYQDNSYMHGFQLGFEYQPYFGYGQGLVTGLYWQYFFNTSVELEDDPLENDHYLMVPVLYQFRLPLAEELSIYVNGGVEMAVGLFHNLQYSGNDDYDSESINLGYGSNEYGDWGNRFQMMGVLGGGIQYKAFQLSFRYGWGMLNNNKLSYWVPMEEITQSTHVRTMEALLQITF